MKRLFIKFSFLLGLAVAAMSFSVNAEAATNDMHRVYNPNSGEHFYTQNGIEKDILVRAGWKYEGIGWYAPQSGDPVYRMYNANAGDHHYTVDFNEKEALVKAGWKYEGVGWYSDTKKTIPLYRAYNPNAKAGSHNYTVNGNEQNMLINAGWRDEGIAWYGTHRDSGGQETPKPKPPVTAVDAIGNSGILEATPAAAEAKGVAMVNDKNSKWFCAFGVDGNPDWVWFIKTRPVSMSDGTFRHTVDFYLWDLENDRPVNN